jgi:hypothetical protein
MEIVDMVTTTNRFRRSRSVSNCPAAAFFDFPWQTDRSRLHLYETVPWWLCSRRICMGNKTDTAIYDICIYIYIYIYIYVYVYVYYIDGSLVKIPVDLYHKYVNFPGGVNIEQIL